MLQKQLLRENGCEGGKLTQRELRGKNGRCERTDFVEITIISIETAAAEETANEVKTVVFVETAYAGKTTSVKGTAYAVKKFAI